MALLATFEPASSRVRLELTGATGAAAASLFSRRLGQVSWHPVRGGSPVTVTSGAAPAVYDHEFPFAAPPSGTVEYLAATDNALTIPVATALVDITDQCWLKVPGYPVLNRRLTVVDYGPVERSGRSALLTPVAAALPLAVGEYMTGRKVEITVRTVTATERATLDFAVALGGVVYLHADEDALGLPSLYAVVTGLTVRRAPRRNAPTRYLEIALTEVAKPAAAYAGVLGTWQTVLGNHASWSAVAGAYSTWNALLSLEGSPADLVTP